MSSRDREEIIHKVVQLAAKILVEEGHEALTVRRIAQESGSSTQLIYTLFGGKFGLLDGLYKEGFIRFRDFMATNRASADCCKNLENWIRSYRDFAIQYRPFFNVMFTRPVPEYVPPIESLEFAWKSLEQLLKAVQKAQVAGFLKGDPTLVALRLWSQSHGIVSLELIGHLSDKTSDQLYEEFIRNIWVGGNCT